MQYLERDSINGGERLTGDGGYGGEESGVAERSVDQPLGSRRGSPRGARISRHLSGSRRGLPRGARISRQVRGEACRAAIVGSKFGEECGAGAEGFKNQSRKNENLVSRIPPVSR